MAGAGRKAAGGRHAMLPQRPDPDLSSIPWTRILDRKAKCQMFNGLVQLGCRYVISSSCLTSHLRAQRPACLQSRWEVGGGEGGRVVGWGRIGKEG